MFSPRHCNPRKKKPVNAFFVLFDFYFLLPRQACQTGVYFLEDGTRIALPEVEMKESVLKDVLYANKTNWPEELPPPKYETVVQVINVRYLPCLFLSLFPLLFFLLNFWKPG
jgi:hypothetical protein